MGSTEDLSNAIGHLVIVIGFVAIGIVSWFVTKWRVEDGSLRVETGVFRRQSLRFPLARVQAIDTVQPLLGQFFGLAELRLRSGSSSQDNAGRLAYLHLRDAQTVRTQLLALAQATKDSEFAQKHEAGPPAESSKPVAPSQEVPDELIAVVPVRRLVASIALSDVGVISAMLLAFFVYSAAAEPEFIEAAFGGGVAWLVTAASLLWRRFNSGYKLSVTQTHDGLRLRSGLSEVTTETIPAGRIQAVRRIEPLFWRPFGWVRLEVELAGNQRRNGENSAEGQQTRAVLPVGSRDDIRRVLDLVAAEAPEPQQRMPGRVWLKAPLQAHFLAWHADGEYVVASSGRVARNVVWVPLLKMQSARIVQGPVQRCLRLSTVHIDAAGKRVASSMRDLDAEAATAAHESIVSAARALRPSRLD